jgi:hypothetical protein
VTQPEAIQSTTIQPETTPSANMQLAEVTEVVSTTLSAPQLIESTLSISVAQAATPAATPNFLTLHIWLPEPLAPVNDEDAAELLSQQISGFVSANPDIHVDLRLKRANDVGGVMSNFVERQRRRTGGNARYNTVPPR